MKTIKLWLTTIAVLLYSITVNAFDFYEGGLAYNIVSEENKEVECIGGYSGGGSSITIPFTVVCNEIIYSVTSIGNNAFARNSSLVSITIPKSVTSIGEFAFSSCYNLTTINIPDGVTSIGKGTFQGCNSLSSIIIPESITSIGDHAFNSCHSLTSICIPESVTSIGYDAFANCGGELIVNCNIPQNGFSRSYFTSVTIGGRVTSVGNSAFYDCKNLTSVTIGDNVTSIGKNAFAGCYSINTISISEHSQLTSIGDDAFGGCCFVSIDLPKGVTSIGNSAFEGCDRLTTINIPDGVTSIGDGTFSYCTSLTSITIPESVTSVGNSAFSYCASLTSITIPESVISIGDGAFSACTSLTSITIPEYVMSIGAWTFDGCKNLTSITFLGKPSISPSYAFQNCNVKKTIWKGNTPSDTYYNIKSAINYIANSDYASYANFKVYPMLGSMFEVDGITYVPTSLSDRTCDIVDYDCNIITGSVNVGPTVIYKNIEFTVNNVNDYAFYGNQYLEEVILANQGSVGTYAFANCTKLTTVNIEEGVTSVGNALFEGCNELAAISVAEGNAKYDSRNNCNAIIEKAANKLVAACNQTVIPESVTAIGDYAFSACGEMTSISIHKDILSVGNYAFSGCSSLADVTIEDRTEVLTLGSNGNRGLFADCPLDLVYIGGKISYDTSSSKGYSPFSNNTTLRTVTITDKEDTIYPYEFYNCSALKNFTIGDGVTSIGDYAFSGCSSMENFSFGCSMKTIGANAFLGCSKMKEISSSAVNPPICGANALNDADKWNCTLYVPVGYMAPYQAADQWKEFLLMEDIIPIKMYTLTYMVDGDVYHTEQLAYNQMIVRPNNPTKEGYSFDEWIGLPTTMPISDVTVNASFTINEYALTYMVDGEEYKTETIAYGTELTALTAPTKEGYTFSGWSELPETMPAKDITITGSFNVNHYMLTYIIDGIIYQSVPVAYGTAITMLEAPAKSGYSFDGWDTTLSVMPAEDVTINGSYTRLPIENFIIRDSDEGFTSEEDLQCDKITYIRNFTNTAWQSLYVPFEIAVTEELLADFEIADLNDIRQYDRDDDGVKDETVVEAFKVKSGATLAANYPYLIRAKEAGEKTITVTDATLFAAEEVSIDCSSIREKFTFTGTYSRKEANELGGCYALCDGVWQPLAADATLGAFRVYLTIESRNSNEVPAQAIRIRVIGEEDVTAIDEMESSANGQQLTVVYDLLGRRIVNADNLKGVYIINGKKVIK